MKFIKDLRVSGKIVLVLIVLLLAATIFTAPYSVIFLCLTGCISIAGSVIVFNFFTKKTDEISKSTTSLIKLIKKADTVYIMGHKRPDFDSLGAAAGIFAIVSSMNKPCLIVSDRKTEALSLVYKGIAGDFKDTDVFVSSKEATDKIDEKALVIIADANCTQMLYDINILKKASNIVVIDHHATQSDIDDNTKLLCVDITASSTSEIVTSMIENIGDISVTRCVLSSLLAGIIVDTNHFTINTDRRTMHAASYLLEMGADVDKVRGLFRVDEGLMQLKARAIQNAEHLNNEILISHCDYECDEAYVAASQAANDLLNINGIEASLVLYSIDGVTYVSGRSCGKIDMNKLLSRIGGGGHLTMAGARFDFENIEEAKIIIKKIVEEMYEEEKLR